MTILRGGAVAHEHVSVCVSACEEEGGKSMGKRERGILLLFKNVIIQILSGKSAKVCGCLRG